MQKKMVVLPQNSSLKLNVPFKMVHHSLGFLYAHLGLHLVCAVNRVSSTVWWNFVQILRYIIALFLWISRKSLKAIICMFGGLSENAVCQQNVIYFNISAGYSAELIG